MRLLSTVVAMALLGSAQLVLAEGYGYMSIDRSPNGKASLAKSINAMHMFSRCVLRHHPAKIDALLASAPASDDEKRIFKSLDGDADCLGNYTDLSGDPYLLRGALAEAIYRKRYSAIEAAALDGALKASPSSSRADAVGKFADCVVDAGPSQVRGLLGTTPNGPEEGTALTALNPLLGPCLDSTSQLRLNKPYLRAILASALVDRLRATEPGTLAMTSGHH